MRPAVTWRSLLLGVLFTALLAWLNCWVETLKSVHFLGGVQMPFGAVFVLLFLIVVVNLPLRALQSKSQLMGRILPPFSAPELMTVYAMSLFGALISTPGSDSQFLVTGPGLFYFSTSENGWASLFYKHVPSWFAPGWNGQTFQEEVINRFFIGGASFSEIPWHAWSAMLIAWSIFLALIYSLLFFTALILRKQWIVNEALPFPLAELPLQMVATDDPGQNPPAKVFWGNRVMWMGFAIAAACHFITGMNAHYPDWPIFPVNSFGALKLEFTEQPWNAIPPLTVHIYLGAIGLAYLLTREVSFSFWFFFLFMLFQYAFAQMLGFPVTGQGNAGIMGRPAFLIYQSIGGWTMMAGILVWSAREVIGSLFREAFTFSRHKAGNTSSLSETEPFSARFTIFGFLASLIGLLFWTNFAGINFFIAVAYLGIFLITSLILARLVVEGGFLFPQAPYIAREWLTTGLFGTAAVGAAGLTKFAFIEQMILYDTRTNTLPAFLHTMRIAEVLGLDRKSQRRLYFGMGVAIVVTMGITIVTSLYAFYSQGALTTYGGDWGKLTFESTSNLLTSRKEATSSNTVWMAVGAGVLLLLVLARSRFIWFPLHPLGYLAAPAYPITQLWSSFFLGWLIKTLIMKYGSSESYNQFRPFMIGLILGNLAAMVFWMLIGFRSGVQSSYWPA